MLAPRQRAPGTRWARRARGLLRVRVRVRVRVSIGLRSLAPRVGSKPHALLSDAAALKKFFDTHTHVCGVVGCYTTHRGGPWERCKVLRKQVPAAAYRCIARA